MRRYQAGERIEVALALNAAEQRDPEAGELEEGGFGQHFDGRLSVHWGYSAIILAVRQRSGWMMEEIDAKPVDHKSRTKTFSNRKQN